jgi:outer membrane biogenesis lipoprotein LolB
MKIGRCIILRHIILRCIILICMIIGLTGCSRMIASMHKAPYDYQTQEHARQLFESALEKNPAPETFKGIGNLKITRDNQVDTGRIAWMAAGNDRIRLELLTPYGQPWATFSSDGQHVYILVYTDQRFYKRSLSGSGLKEIISISVQPEEIISLLLGRPPEVEYSFISMIDSTTAPGPVLVVQERWWTGHQIIFLDKTGDYFRSVEVYDGSGELKYKADFFHKIENGHRVPSRLEISNGQGTGVQLAVNRHWAEVDISPSAFILTPP